MSFSTQLDIARDLIEGAPPGELIEVIDGIKIHLFSIFIDLGKICGHEFLSQLGSVVKRANMTNCITIQIPLPDGREKKCLITPYNKVEGEEDTFQYDEFQFVLNPFSLVIIEFI